MTKIFVGNVPFYCTRDEFINCFKNFDGFLDGELVYRTNYMNNQQNIGRGFGFITFINNIYANKFMEANYKILLKNRLLRYTKYIIPNKMTYSKNELTNHNSYFKNLLYIKNIPNNICYNDIKNIFLQYTNDVGIIVIDKINSTNNNAIVEIKDKEIYNLLLNMKYIIIDSIQVDIEKLNYKIKKKYDNSTVNLNDIYNVVNNSNKNNDLIYFIFKQIQIETQ